MIERRARKPPYLIITIAVSIWALVTFGMYESFVVHSVSGPTKEAAERTVNALDPNGEVATERARELPVWPPPSATTPVDPAKNPMQGALPMRVDWPDAAIAKPRSAATR